MALPALLARRFVPHALAPPLAALIGDAPPFRVFTWNHLGEGLDVHGDFTVDPSVLPWSFRGPRIAEILASADADIVCLMEVTDLTTVVRSLPGYDLFFAPKPASPALDKGGPPDGTALLVRRARFAVASAETLHFAGEVRSGGEGYAGVIANQVALLCELRDRAAGGRAVIVGAAHLKAKAGAANEAVREGQARQLLASATALLAGRTDTPVILAGDFNETPRGPAYATVLADPLRLCSAYNALPTPPPGSSSAAALSAYARGEPAFTTWKFRGASAAEKKETIDYVWFGPPTARLARLATLALPGEAEVGPAALPSAAWPSDHLALGVDFAWLAEGEGPPGEGPGGAPAT